MVRQLIASLALLSAATMALAGTATPAQRIDARQERQAARMAEGAESGALTQREQARLARQQRAIGKMEARVEADGTVTAKEAHAVEKAQDRASRRIAHAKHDRQVQPPAP